MKFYTQITPGQCARYSVCSGKRSVFNGGRWRFRTSDPSSVNASERQERQPFTECAPPAERPKTGLAVRELHPDCTRPTIRGFDSLHPLNLSACQIGHFPSESAARPSTTGRGIGHGFTFFSHRDATAGEGYWCVVCGRFLPSDDGVIVHDDVPHPADMIFDDEESPQ